MSKLAVFALFCVLGAAVYMILIVYYPPFVQLIRGIPTDVTSFVAWIKSNLTAIIPTAAGVGTVITLLYNQVYKRAKQAQQALTTEKVAEAQNLVIAKTSEAADYKEKYEVARQQVTTLQQASQNVATLQETITAQQKQIETLIAEKNEAERIFRQKYLTEPKPPQVK